ncbi:MAG TPA: AAA family ATPase, partial [Pseudomonadota bacterium]|nr:AAA family ATPase [Pseudomonadota bacterium]
GEPASERSDLYAVGVLAFQMFTDTYPFAIGHRRAALLQQILTGAPDLAPLPAAMQPVLGQALRKLPSLRQADAATLRRELAAATGLALTSEPVATRDSYLIAARFVGRQAELRELQEALSAAWLGLGSAWLVCGESGVGKSRLLEELRCGALRAGVLVLRGQATPGGDAYHLWRDVLKLLALQVPLDELEAGILGRLLPELPQLLESAVAAPPALDAPGARLRLFHVVEALLARLPDTALVVLEDLQWADSESLALLSHLANWASGRALLMVATCREEEGAQAAAALPQLRRLRLLRLDRREQEALCESMLGPSARNRALLDRIAAETEGNAYFIVEVMRALAAERGSLAEVGIGRLPERLLSGGIEQVLERRLSRAPVAARPLLHLAAVAGRDLDPILLSHLLPDTEEQIRALADVGLLELYAQRWRFGHDKLRERVRDSLSPDDRQRLHQRLAEALVQVYPGDESRAALVAAHYREAHEPAPAAHYYALAGDAALRRGAPAEAAALLEQARLLHAQTTMPQLAQVRLWRGLTEARFGLGRLHEAEVALRQLCAAAGTPLPAEPLRLWSRVGRLAAELLGKRLGLMSATQLADPDQRAIAAELLAGLGVEEVFVWTDQPELALLCTLFGLHLEDQLGLAPRRNYHRSALFFILSHTPLRGLCLRYIEHIEHRDADVLSGTHAEIDFLRVRALVELNDGQLERAAEHAARAVALARNYKDDLALLHSLLQLQLAAAGLCDFAQMLAVSREMEPLAVRAENARYLVLANIGQGAAQLNLGEYAEAAIQLEKGRTYLSQELGLIPESVTLSLLASARRNLEQFEPAVELASQALDSVQRARWSLVQLRHTYVCILDAYLAAPQPARYASQIEIALAKLRGLARRFPHAVPDALLFAALADWRLGRPTRRTAELFRKSITTACKLGMKMEPATAQYWFGCFAKSSAGASWVREGAEPHLRAALMTFERFKAAGMVSRTRAALQSRGDRGGAQESVGGAAIE